MPACCPASTSSTGSAGSSRAGCTDRRSRPTGGISRLRLIPIETVPTGAHQQALWGGSGAEDERAHRALARVQTLLGHGSVLTPVLDGGRDPRPAHPLVRLGRRAGRPHSPAAAWPGRLPAPAPSVLIDPPRPIPVLDAPGRPVRVTDRGSVPMPPARFGLLGDARSTSRPGPGPGRSTNAGGASRPAGLRARFQLVDVRGQAYLVACAVRDGEPVWTLEARYD